MSELTYKSATELAAMVRAKKVSSSEVIDAHIARLDILPQLKVLIFLLIARISGNPMPPATMLKVHRVARLSE